MIDLNKLTQEEAEVIERLIEEEIESAYGLKNATQLPYMRDRCVEKIKKLTILQVKMINLQENS